MADTWTAEDIATLKAAIAKGVRSVKYQDKEVVYNSIDDMLRALRLMQNEVDPTGAGSGGRGTRLFAEAGKGLS